MSDNTLENVQLLVLIVTILGVIVTFFINVFFTENKKIKKILYALLTIFAIFALTGKYGIDYYLKKQLEIQNTQIDNDEKSFEGKTIALALLLNENNENRDKYIFDFGESLNKNRMSIFLNNKNNLCFKIVDDFGDINTIRISDIDKDFDYDQVHFYFFDIGFSKEYSFLKIFIDGERIDKKPLQFKFPINTKSILSRGNIGADLDGENLGNFNIYFTSIHNGTLTKSKKQAFMETIKWYLDRVLPDSDTTITNMNGSFYLKISDNLDHLERRYINAKK